MRLEISNQYGDSDLVIDAMYVAKLLAPSSSEIDTSTNIQVTYNGSGSFTVPAGETVETDEIAISFTALEDLAISMEIGATAPTVLTGHRGARCHTWIASGDMADDASISDAEIKTSWYFISMANTVPAEDTNVIVAFGDSLTDGASVTTNAYARWTDELARQLQASGDMKNYGVVNMGIGATTLYGGMGRIDRDIINVPGTEAVIVFYGTNDIAKATDVSKADEVISLYESLITQCHAAGIKVYMATLTPSKGASSDYYSETIAEIKAVINAWVKSDECPADGYIDFETTVADPADHEIMKSEYVSVWNDWLHFNDSGYTALGLTAYNALREYLLP